MAMFNPPHPGRLVMNLLVRDEDGNEIDTIANVADKLRFHRSTLNRVVKCETSITPAMALALESIGAGSAEHWLAMQTSFDLFRLRHSDAGTGVPFHAGEPLGWHPGGVPLPAAYRPSGGDIADDSERRSANARENPFFRFFSPKGLQWPVKLSKIPASQVWPGSHRRSCQFEDPFFLEGTDDVASTSVFAVCRVFGHFGVSVRSWLCGRRRRRTVVTRRRDGSGLGNSGGGMLFGISPALRLLERARHDLVGEFRHRFILSFRLVMKSFYDESVELCHRFVVSVQFLQHGKRLPPGRTLFANIRSVPPGSVLTLDQGGEIVADHRFAPLEVAVRITEVEQACTMIRAEPERIG